jgi:hypothetical protein
MKEILQTTIEQLRFHVMKNLELVRENEREIKEMLKDPVSPTKAQILSEKYDYSKRVLAENNDFINLQLSIINFIYKYKGVWEKESELAPVNEAQTASLSRDECFQLTIDSKLAFDPKHPFYNDESFFDNLLEFFKARENYEKCDELVKTKK